MTIFLLALGLLTVVGLFYWLRFRKNVKKHSGHGHSHGKTILSIDILAYSSAIGHWNPGFKVGFSLLLLLICVTANNLYVSVLVILITGYITIIMGGVSFRDYLSYLRIPVAFLVLGSLAILFNFSKEPLGIWNLNLHFSYLYISQNSLMTTTVLWGKAFGAVSAMYMLSLSTPSSEIFSVLRSLHFPKLIIELMNMIYRYIFILMDTQFKMKNSAESRLGYCDFKTALSTFGHSMSNLLVVSLKKAGQYYDAMESRCYDGDLLFLEAPKPLKKIMLLNAGLVIALLLAVCFL